MRRGLDDRLTFLLTPCRLVDCEGEFGGSNDAECDGELNLLVSMEVSDAL